MKLSNEEKRIKIAEILGTLKKSQRPKFRYENYSPVPDGFEEVITSPNYCSDLNAIHSAIMSQSDLFRKAMRLYLWEGTSQMSAHFATAEEMADAFLATHEHLSKTKN